MIKHAKKRGRLRRRSSGHTQHWETIMNISKHQNSRYSLVAIFSTVLAVGLAQPTSAGALVGPDIKVLYEDLAINTEQGSLKLLKRIEVASARVCARLDHGDLASRSNAKACSRKVTAAAIKNVNHPMLLAVYNSKLGVAPPLASLSK
jgi:UrcA family protein